MMVAGVWVSPLPSLWWQRPLHGPAAAEPPASHRHRPAACREHPLGSSSSLEPLLTRYPPAPLERQGGLIPTRRQASLGALTLRHEDHGSPRSTQRPSGTAMLPLSPRSPSHPVHPGREGRGVPHEPPATPFSCTQRQDGPEVRGHPYL